ncbi:transposase, partial [Candidatus Gottesmanbacteria bacterium]|nr:transposase [Candidatus Gottesmanbacteria bacterium]
MSTPEVDKLFIEDAKKVILWYTRRWIIERFHYCLKSGCRIEELQLQEKKRLERALAIYCIVAWKLLYLTYYAREYPDHSCM